MPLCCHRYFKRPATRSLSQSWLFLPLEVHSSICLLPHYLGYQATAFWLPSWRYNSCWSSFWAPRFLERGSAPSHLAWGKSILLQPIVWPMMESPRFLGHASDRVCASNLSSRAMLESWFACLSLAIWRTLRRLDLPRSDQRKIWQLLRWSWYHCSKRVSAARSLPRSPMHLKSAHLKCLRARKLNRRQKLWSRGHALVSFRC